MDFGVIIKKRKKVLFCKRKEREEKMISIDTGFETIVTVDGMTKKELYEGIDVKQFIKSRDKRIEIAETLVKKLKVCASEYFDESITPTGITSDITGSFSYIFQGREGRIEMSAMFLDDFKSVLKNQLYVNIKDDQKEEWRNALKEKKGLVIERANYYIKSNNTDDRKPEEGLFLHRQIAGPFRFCSFKDITKPFQAYLNALFKEEEIEAAWVQEPKYMNGPMHYADGTTETYARIANPTIERLQKADETVGPFFTWLKKNKSSVDAVGDLIRYAYEQFTRAEYQRSLVTMENQLPKRIAEKLEETAARYVAEARKIKVEPITTKRVNYFI